MLKSWSHQVPVTKKFFPEWADVTWSHSYHTANLHPKNYSHSELMRLGLIATTLHTLYPKIIPKVYLCDLLPQSTVSENLFPQSVHATWSHTAQGHARMQGEGITWWDQVFNMSHVQIRGEILVQVGMDSVGRGKECSGLLPDLKKGWWIC